MCADDETVQYKQTFSALKFSHFLLPGINHAVIAEFRITVQHDQYFCHEYES